MTWREASAGGILFYDDPSTNMPQVDALIRPVVESINASGWVWTAESCQGHPDATTRLAGWGRVSPYLRLGVRESDLGRMMSRLVIAMQFGSDGGIQAIPFRIWSRRFGTYVREDAQFPFAMLRPFDADVSTAGWNATSEWIEVHYEGMGQNVYDRTLTLAALERFAKSLRMERT